MTAARNSQAGIAQAVTVMTNPSFLSGFFFVALAMSFVPVSAFALFNQRYGMLHGGSFPSAHIAASVIALAALSPRQRLVLLPVALSIFVSVIALRYHYRVDVAAGIVVGLGAIAFDRAFVALGATARNPESAEPEAAKAKRYAVPRQPLR